jgi:hypothetical protein
MNYDAQSIAGEDAWSQIPRGLDACVGKGHDDWAKTRMHGPRLAMDWKQLDALNTGYPLESPIVKSNAFQCAVGLAVQNYFFSLSNSF